MFSEPSVMVADDHGSQHDVAEIGRDVLIAVGYL